MSHHFNELKRKTDLSSFAEMVDAHAELIDQKKLVKGMVSKDAETLRIAQNIISKQSHDLSYVLKEQTNQINELASIKVEIDSIKNFPDHFESYKRDKEKDVMICVGGPSAEDQALIASLIPQIKNRLDKIIYVTRSYAESNLASSAKQYHIRHANALNANDHLTGRAIIRSVVKRAIFGVTKNEMLSPNFLKIDVSGIFSSRNLPIYLGNELNSIIQKIREFRGKLTEHDINRIGAFLGGEFFEILEKEIGEEISGRKDSKGINHPSAIHVTFDEKGSCETQKESELLKKINIPFCELNSEQIENFFGQKNEIYKAFGYPSDTHVKFCSHEINKNFAIKNGVNWIEGLQVNKILFDYHDNRLPKMAGIIDQNGHFIYANKLHFSGGYRVEYVYANSSKNVLRNKMTISTGVSVNAIFRKRQNFGEISVTNSHWTKIAEDENYALARITGGGNTGSEQYNPAYFINLMANSRRIFGDDLIGVFSTYGCSRAINAKNSTQWAELGDGCIVSYGKGGTGNTKRHFEALKALHKLGFAKEINDFCNQIRSSRGGFLGDRLNEIIALSEADFSCDQKKKVAKNLKFC